MKNTILAGAIVAIVVLSGGAYLWSVKTASAPVVRKDETTKEVSQTQHSGGDTVFTAAQVAAHNDKTSCYSIINGTVYDLTSWIDRHPGGAKQILGICGKDGTSAFDRKHEGEPRPEQMLATFAIGSLVK